MTLQTIGAGEGRLNQDSGPAGDMACRFVEALVGASLGVPVSELRRPSRGRAAAALARQTAMYLAHVHLGLSLQRVGTHFGRDRTTVAHACRRIEDRRDKPGFERLLIQLEAALQCWKRSVPAAEQAP